MIGVGIVGDGELNARRLAAYRRVERVDVRATAGPRPPTGEGESIWTGDYRDLLARADVEVVDLSAPAGDQVEIGVEAARAGKQVLVDYLPGASVEEADRLIAACREADVGLTVLLPARQHPLARELKRTLVQGKLGPLKFVHTASISGQQSASPREITSFDPSDFLVERGTPRLDLVAWFFETPIARVFARGCPLDGADGSSGYVSVVLFFADASQAICEIGLNDELALGSEVRRLALTGLRGSAYHESRDGDLLLGTEGTRLLTDEEDEGLVSALTEWAATSAAGHDAGVEDARATLRLALAAAESLRTGRPVEVGG
jgi:myo-inositol 2-dehydrogenase/D-chiro-inositol 1-dehydrogenase